MLIEECGFCGLTHMSQLDISNNRIELLRKPLFNNDGFEKLFLQRNPIIYVNGYLTPKSAVDISVTVDNVNLCCYFYAAIQCKLYKSSDQNKTFNRDDMAACRDIFRNKYIAYCLCILACFGAICNVFAFIVKTSFTKLAYNVPFQNNAALNIFSCVYTSSLLIADATLHRQYIAIDIYWLHNFYCRFLNFVFAFNTTAVNMSPLIILLNIHLLSKHPLNKKLLSGLQVIVAVVSTWSLSVVVATTLNSYQRPSDNYICNPYLFQTKWIMAFPFSIMAIFWCFSLYLSGSSLYYVHIIGQDAGQGGNVNAMHDRRNRIFFVRFIKVLLTNFVGLVLLGVIYYLTNVNTSSDTGLVTVLLIFNSYRSFYDPFIFVFDEQFIHHYYRSIV